MFAGKQFQTENKQSKKRSDECRMRCGRPQLFGISNANAIRISVISNGRSM